MIFISILQSCLHEVVMTKKAFLLSHDRFYSITYTKFTPYMYTPEKIKIQKKKIEKHLQFENGGQ